MSELTYNEFNATALRTSIIQRLGYDSSGRPLVTDGVVGPLTEGATYLDPWTASAHPVVAVAIAELLRGAKELAAANNRGKFPEKYMPQWAYGGAWCAGFQSWALRQVWGVGTPYIVGAQRLGRALAEEGEEVEPEHIGPGDYLVWDRDGPDPGDEPADDMNGHIGICAARVGRIVWTVDGNRGPLVRAWRHDLDDLSMGPNEPFLFAARHKPWRP